MKTHLSILKIDLNKRKTEQHQKQISESSLEEKLGGVGIGFHNFKNHLEEYPDIRDAYDEDNPLEINIGFLTGANRLGTALRTYFSGLSPLKTNKAGTNGFFYSAVSGDFGIQIRHNNLDSIRIQKKSKDPVFLVIDNGKVSYENGSELIGKSTSHKIRVLAEKYNDAAFAVIGPAAENYTRFGSIAISTSEQLRKKNKLMRFAGRGGMGTVMRDKNLYAIVIRGDKTNKFDVGNVKDMNLEMARGERTTKYRDYGTMFGNILSMEMLRANVHNNFSRGSDERTEKLYMENLLNEGYEINSLACQGCGIRCWKTIKDERGKLKGKVDFEPGALLGLNLGIYNLDQIMTLVRIVDEMGMDAITAGVSIGYLLEEENRFGDFEYIRKTLIEIGKGKHPLKEGVFRYSEGDSYKAMHVKGIEFAAYSGNLNPGNAFAIGGPHMTMDTYSRAWYTKAENTVNEWIDNVIVRGVNTVLYDFDGMCKFSKINFGDVTELFERVYGGKITIQELKDTALNVYKQIRNLDRQLGFTQEDDVIPERCFEDLNLGLKHFLTKDFFTEFKKGVYDRGFALK